MNLIKQPTAWSCGPTSLAMLLDIDVRDIMRSIGHDGSAILFPDEVAPVCRRGFHVQELIDVALVFGYSLVTVEFRPITCTNRYPDGYEIFSNDWNARISRYLESYRGLILCQNNAAQCHMVAWDRKYVYDPMQPRKFDFGDEDDDISPESFLMLAESNHNSTVLPI